MVALAYDTAQRGIHGIANAAMATPEEVRHGLERICWMPTANGGSATYIQFAALRRVSPVGIPFQRLVPHPGGTSTGAGQALTDTRMTAPRLRQLVSGDRCALLLQEVQIGVVDRPGVLGGLAEAVAKIGLVTNLERLTSAARQAGVPVIHCTAADLVGGFGSNRNARLFAAARRAGTLQEASGTLVQPMPSLIGPTDVVIPRYQGLSPLTGSQLDSLLRNHGVTTVVVTGVSLNVAIPNLVFDAINRSYQVVLPVDAVAGVPVDYGKQVVEHTLRPLATLVSVDDLIASWT